MPDPYTDKSPSLIDAESLASWIMEDTPDYVVFNKPGWVVCHPSKNGPWSSLVGAAREYLGIDRMHLVSRLDRETSGVVVLAKHRASASRMQTAFAQRRTRKRYLALLCGRLSDERTTESNLENDPDSPVAVKQRISFGGRGKPAITRFRPLEYWGDYTLAEVEPITGRKHQIRAHAQWLEHPVAGDKIYGGDPTCYLEFIEHGWTPRMAAVLKFHRQALHAHSIEIFGEGFSYEFVAPCPFEAEGFRTLAS